MGGARHGPCEEFRDNCGRALAVVPSGPIIGLLTPSLSVVGEPVAAGARGGVKKLEFATEHAALAESDAKRFGSGEAPTEGLFFPARSR